MSLNFQIGGVGVTTQRNYFGRQIQSFESHIELKDPQLAMVSVVFNSVIYFEINFYLELIIIPAVIVTFILTGM